MSEDFEARLLSLDCGFADFLKNTSEKFGDLSQKAVESTVETANAVSIVLEELIDGGALDRAHLTAAIEAHSRRAAQSSRSASGGTAVETLLANLRRAGSRPN
jgi:hypothetical protein